MSTAAAGSPPRRPRIAPHERKWWLAAAVATIAGVALAFWFGVSANRGPSWTDPSYQVVNDQLVRVGYVVHRPAGREVTCTVRALDVRFGTVGSVQVQIPAGDSTSVRRTTMVQTTTRAVTGEVQACVFTGPDAGS